MMSSSATPVLTAVPDAVVEPHPALRDATFVSQGAVADASVVVLVLPGALEPESLRQLGDRLRCAVAEHLHHARHRTLSAVPAPGRRLVAGGVDMDLDQLKVNVANREVVLRHQEFRLLRAFLEHPGKVFSRRQLLELAWERDAQQHDRTVDVHVRRLRAKLGAAAAGIVTVRGFGYRFEAA